MGQGKIKPGKKDSHQFSVECPKQASLRKCHLNKDLKEVRELDMQLSLEECSWQRKRSVPKLEGISICVIFREQ